MRSHITVDLFMLLFDLLLNIWLVSDYLFPCVASIHLLFQLFDHLLLGRSFLSLRIAFEVLFAGPLVNAHSCVFLVLFFFFGQLFLYVLSGVLQVGFSDGLGIDSVVTELSR